MPGAIGGIGSWLGQNIVPALGKVGGFLKSNLGTIIPGVIAGGGALANILQQRQYQNQLNRYNAEQQFAFNLAKNPQAMAQYVAGQTRPLEAGLTQGVEREVQAALGERGLTLSPNIAASVYAQALAPFELQARQLGAQTAMEGLQLGTSMGQPYQPRPYDISGPLGDLMKRFDPAAPTPDPNNPVFQGPAYQIPDISNIGSDNPDMWSTGSLFPVGGPTDWSSIISGVSSDPTVDYSGILNTNLPPVFSAGGS